MGGHVELLDTVDEADKRGSVVPVCKLGMVVDVTDGDGRVLVAERQGALEAVVAAPGMGLGGAISLGNGRVVRGKARPTQQLAKSRHVCPQKIKSKSLSGSSRVLFYLSLESCDFTCRLHKLATRLFFFQTQRRPYCGPRCPVEAGTVQTDVGERLCGISKTVFADGSSRWLRGEDAGSPGAFLHLLYVDLLNFHVAEDEDPGKGTQPLCPRHNCGCCEWRDQGEAEAKISVKISLRFAR